MPSELVGLLFGSDGMATDRLTTLDPVGDEGDDPEDATGVGAPSASFLNPFKPRADSDYTVEILGGRRRRGRLHERLVNGCAEWLARQGFKPGMNAAVDLGTQDPPVIIEAKMVGESWAHAVRQAVSQLYEYRYFKVADPTAGLVFLASRPVPAEWLRYLERDREIGVMWPTKPTGFHLSPLAERYLEL